MQLKEWESLQMEIRPTFPMSRKQWPGDLPYSSKCDAVGSPQLSLLEAAV